MFLLAFTLLSRLLHNFKQKRGVVASWCGSLIFYVINKRTPNIINVSILTVIISREGVDKEAVRYSQTLGFLDSVAAMFLVIRIPGRRGGDPSSYQRVPAGRRAADVFATAVPALRVRTRQLHDECYRRRRSGRPVRATSPILGFRLGDTISPPPHRPPSHNQSHRLHTNQHVGFVTAPKLNSHGLFESSFWTEILSV